MRHKKLNLSLLIILVLGLTGLHAQETIAIAGGDASGSGGSSSFSIGQVFCTINTGDDGSLTEGVQQPYEITVDIESQQGTNINLVCRAYPNPAREYLVLDVEYNTDTELAYQLHDMNGNMIESKKILAKQTMIMVCFLQPATYFLRITTDQAMVKVFKIVKN